MRPKQDRIHMEEQTRLGLTEKWTAVLAGILYDWPDHPKFHRHSLLLARWRRRRGLRKWNRSERRLARAERRGPTGPIRKAFKFLAVLLVATAIVLTLIAFIFAICYIVIKAFIFVFFSSPGSPFGR